MVLKEYWRLSGPDLTWVCFGTCAGILAAYYSAIVTDVTSKVISNTDIDLGLLWRTSAIVVWSTALRGMCFTFAQKRLDKRVSVEVYKALFRSPRHFYETTPCSSVIKLATDDVRCVTQNISLCLNVITRSAVSLLVTLAIMLQISPFITMIAVILVPCNILLSHVYSKLHEKLMCGYDGVCQDITRHLHDTLNHTMLLRTYGVDLICIARYYELFCKVYTYTLRETCLYGANTLIIFNLPMLSLIVLLTTARQLNITSYPGFVTLVFHQQTLLGSCKSILDFYHEYCKCREPWSRVKDLLSANDYKEGIYIPSAVSGDVEFKDVSFKYATAESNTLTSINLRLQAGEKVALIGKSGSGKSTIAKLLVGMHHPCSGVITIDNVDIQTYDPRWLSNLIGYVSQEVVMFADTIAYNISFGHAEYSREQVVEAAKKAQAHDFISKLPMGYDTILKGTEMGNLSGGQKQRIAIARVLLKQAGILVFDEATSALDPESEEDVQTSINAIASSTKATVLVIAHRPSAYNFVDRVCALNNGCFAT